MHFYLPNGKLTGPSGLPSPTTILGIRANPSLEAWKHRVGLEAAEDKRDEAAMRGTAVHKAVENFLKGEDVGPLTESTKVYFEGFINWYDKYQPTDIQSEVFVISAAHGYAGRTDLICKIDGSPHIVDIKTSRRMEPGMGLQLSAYANAWYEMSGMRAATSVLQLTPELKRKYRFKSYDDEIEVFLAHKKVFDWAVGKRLLTYDGISL